MTNYKKYRLGYCYSLNSKESFTYKNDYIGAMSIDLLFKVFDDSGEELFFEDKELVEQDLQFKNGESYSLTDFVSCSFDRVNILKFQRNFNLLIGSGYKVEWEVESYCKELDKGIYEPEEISKKDFMDIIINNMDLFDYIDNYPASSVAYFTREIAN